MLASVLPLPNAAGLRSLALQKEVALMIKRIILLVTVAMVLAASMMALAEPALATVHPLANMECSNDAHASAVTQNQDPPGLTPGGPDQSHATVAQPVISVFTAQGPNSPAFKTPPVPGPAEYCPAQN